MNYIKLSYFLILSIICGAFSSAQEMVALEKKLLKLEKDYSVEKTTLDSINMVLQIQIDELDILKKDDEGDAAKITFLMSQAHPVSKQADAQNDIVTNLAAQIQKQRFILYKKYSVSIDSLTKNQTVNSDQQLKELTYKRSLVSPALPLFSFDPVLIERIDLANTNSSLEKSIHHDYLSNALSEIDSNIKVINNKKDEVSTMIRLNEQTEDFIDDLDGTQFLSSFDVDTEGDNNNRENIVFGSDGADFGPGKVSDNLLEVYEHLKPVMNELIETPGVLNTDSLASDDYLKLLQGTEKTLKLYRKIIQDKMDRN